MHLGHGCWSPQLTQGKTKEEEDATGLKCAGPRAEALTIPAGTATGSQSPPLAVSTPSLLAFAGKGTCYPTCPSMPRARMDNP